MENLAQIAGRVGRQLRTLPARGRLAVLICSVLILLGIVFAARRTTGDTLEPLFDGQTFSFAELARMSAAFREAGLLDSKIVGNQLHVPRDEQDRYLVVLQTGDALPLAIDDSVDRAAAKNSLFASPGELERGYRLAEQKKLARIVASMHGIETASVQYDEIKKSGFPPTVEIRAFVAARAIGGRHLEYEEIEAIRDTVAGYVAGLERGDVTVTDLEACRTYPGSYDMSDPVAGGRAYTTLKRMFEREYRENILCRLEMYPGVVVAVDVQLSVPTANDAATVPETSLRHTPLVPTSVRASIGVPRSQIVQAWRRRQGQRPNATPDTVELLRIEDEIHADIEQTVAAMLPPPAVGTTARQVTVTSHWDTGSPGTATPEIGQSFVIWLDGNRPTVALVSLVIAAVSLVGVWRYRARLCWVGKLAKRATRRARPAGSAKPREVSKDIAADVDATELQSAIGELVRQDPEAAAKLIRNWLDEAA